MNNCCQHSQSTFPYGFIQSNRTLFFLFLHRKKPIFFSSSILFFVCIIVVLYIEMAAKRSFGFCVCVYFLNNKNMFKLLMSFFIDIWCEHSFKNATRWHESVNRRRSCFRSHHNHHRHTFKVINKGKVLCAEYNIIGMIGKLVKSFRTLISKDWN